MGTARRERWQNFLLTRTRLSSSLCKRKAQQVRLANFEEKRRQKAAEDRRIKQQAHFAIIKIARELKEQFNDDSWAAFKYVYEKAVAGELKNYVREKGLDTFNTNPMFAIKQAFILNKWQANFDLLAKTA